MWDHMDHGQVFVAQAGWDDTDEMLFQGGFDDDGNTLVRCQLFTGRDITKEHDPDRAQGTKLVCQILDGLGIPVKGAKVFLICPHGMQGKPGAYVIVGSVTKQALRKNIEAGSVVDTAPSGEACIMKKPDGSIIIHTTDDNSPTGSSIFLRISSQGLEFRSPYGNFEIGPTRNKWDHHSGGQIAMGAVSIPLLPGAVSDAFTGYCTIKAATCKMEGNSCFIGAPAILKQPAMLGTVKTTPGPPPPNQVVAFADMLQSSSVYISP